MKTRILPILLIIAFMMFLFPKKTYAVIQNLNGQTAQSQTFQNDSNLTISSAGNIHSLGWQGLLPMSRGGTGASSFTAGSLLFSNGTNVSQDNQNLFWDDINNMLGIGTTDNLAEFDGLAINMLANPNEVATGFGVGQNHSKGINIYWTGSSVDPEGLGYGAIDTFGYDTDLWLNGRNILMQNDSGGNVGIGFVINPNAKLDVAGTIRGDSTLFLGNSSTPSCIAMADSDGSGTTYVTANDGVLSATTSKPGICQ